jgi:hypothetical protein
MSVRIKQDLEIALQRLELRLVKEIRDWKNPGFGLSSGELANSRLLGFSRCHFIHGARSGEADATFAFGA